MEATRSGYSDGTEPKDYVRNWYQTEQEAWRWDRARTRISFLYSSDPEAESSELGGVLASSSSSES